MPERRSSRKAACGTKGHEQQPQGCLWNEGARAAAVRLPVERRHSAPNAAADSPPHRQQATP